MLVCKRHLHLAAAAAAAAQQSTKVEQQICLRSTSAFLLPSFRAARALWSVAASGVSAAARAGSAALRLLLGPAALAANTRLELLLPRAAYACAAAAAVLAVLHAMAAARRFAGAGPPEGCTAGASNDHTSCAAAHSQDVSFSRRPQYCHVATARACAVELAAAAGAPLTAVLGRRGPLPLLLAAAQAAALLRLLSLRCCARRLTNSCTVVPSSRSQLSWSFDLHCGLASLATLDSQIPRLLEASKPSEREELMSVLDCLPCRLSAQQQLHGRAGSTAPVGGLLWSLLALQLFFCTGHFCEFAGLQYTAGVLLTVLAILAN